MSALTEYWAPCLMALAHRLLKDSLQSMEVKWQRCLHITEWRALHQLHEWESQLGLSDLPSEAFCALAWDDD